MQQILKVLANSFRFLILSVVLVLFILTQGCVKGVKESGSSAALDTSPIREDQKTVYEFVSISDSVGGILSTPEGEGPFAVALLFGRSDRLGRDVRLGEGIGEAIRGTREALHRSGFAVLETRKKRIGGITGLIMSSPRVPSASEVEKALQIMGHIDRVDPNTVGVIGAGDGAVAAAELAGAKHFRGQRSGAKHSGAKRPGTKRPGSQRSFAFLILLVDLLTLDAPIEEESPLVTVLQGVQTPVLILGLEGDSRESAESAKEAFVAGLDNGISSDYTVKIIRSAETRSEAELRSAEIGSPGDPGEQNPVQQFIFRWLRARF